MSKSKILFCVSGSISAYKAAEAVSKLVQKGHEVQVVMSPSAERFIGSMTFEGLTGKPALKDIFEEGKAMAHIDLARWADLFVLCPASANKLAELAHGAANDLIGSLFLARSSHIPALIFPAMNTVMWSHPFVQANRAALNTLPNTCVIAPGAGHLACGETGEGRLPEPEQIINEIEKILKNKLPLKKILITGGGTVEQIDAVRSITNTSTGETASKMAQHFTDQGYQVDLLLSQSAKHIPNLSAITRFSTHKDLSEKLQKKLSGERYDGIIHLAAVSDFTPHAAEGKISSDQETLTLTMKRTPKIIHSLREWSKNKQAVILGFKLSVNSSLEERRKTAQDLIQKNNLDGAVSNDLSKISESSHGGFLLNTKGEIKNFRSKTEMFNVIQNILEDKR